MPDGRTKQLIQKVMFRLQLVGIGQAAFWSLIAIGGVYLLAVLVTHGTGMYSEYFPWWSALIVPALALVVGVITHHRPSETVAARLADERAGTHDLFLTAAMLDTAAGDYKSLVSEAAEGEAPKVQPSTVVPFDWTGRTVQACGIMGVLIASTFLPNFDPFGNQEEQAKQEQTQKQIKEVKQIAAQRAAALERNQVEAVHSEEVQKKLEEMKNEFQKMKPNNPKQNLDRLRQMQKEIGQQWKKSSEQRAKDALNRRRSSHKLGQGSRVTEEWKSDFEKGKTDGLRQEMNRLQDLAKELSKTTDEKRQQELRDDIQKGLENMAEFSQNEAGSKNLTDSINNASKMAETAGKEGMTEEAAEALEEALKQSEMELEQIAQSVRDVKSLEEALKTIQDAKELNDMEPLDGEQMNRSDALEEYREMMKERLEQQKQQNQSQNQDGQQGDCETCSGSGCKSCGGTGKKDGGQSGQQQGNQPGQQSGGQQPGGQQPGGQQPGQTSSSQPGGESEGSPGELPQNQDFSDAGQQPGQQGQGQQPGQGQGQGQAQGGQGQGQGGMGGFGQGRGGIAPEDPSSPFDFTPEKENSRLTAGKMLLKWKTKGVSDKGEDTPEYQQAVTQLKQEASAAITDEEIPPGYREAIKNYFDTIDRTAKPGAAGATGESAGPRAE